MVALVETLLCISAQVLTRHDLRSTGMHMGVHDGGLCHSNRLSGSGCSLTCHMWLRQGSGGQSFGCFLVTGSLLRLIGEAKEYVGKSMVCGEIVIVPPPASPSLPHETSLVGNTCLYGATGGRLFVHGRAGGLTAVLAPPCWGSETTCA